MPITIEVCARKVNDAIEEGLAKLNKTLDDVDVKIISQGGLFRKAKVQLTVIGSEDEPEIKEIKPEVKPEPKPAMEKPVAKKENFAREEKPFQKKERPARPDRERKPAPAKAKENFERKPIEKSEQTAPRKEEKVYNEITKEVEAEAVAYLSNAVRLMGVEAEIQTEIKNGALLLNIVTENSAVIGYRGETLDALEYLTSLVVNKIETKYYKVSVNSNGYREKREKMLVELANKMAAKCIKQNRKVVLEPMNNSGRKIIHAALSGNDKVITRSEGHEPNRRVVIFAVRNKKQ